LQQFYFGFVGLSGPFLHGSFAGIEFVISFLRFFFLTCFISLSIFGNSPEGETTWGQVRRNLLKPSVLKNIIKEKVADLHVGLDLKFLSLSAFEGIGLAARYRYEFEPSYQEGFFQRVDHWKLRTSLLPGSLLQNVFNFPLAFHLEGERELLYIRQFKSHEEALKAKPYHLRQLPFTAKKALENLNPGDFVLIPCRLNLMVEARAGVGAGLLSSEVSTHYLISGEFQIQVLRVKGDKVRLRLIALKRREHQLAGARTGLGLNIFGLKIFGKQLEAVLDVDLAKVSRRKETGGLIVLDYLFDLKHEEARVAYDELLKVGYKFKSLPAITSHFNDEKFKNLMVQDISAVEELCRRELEKPKKSRIVRRIFKGIADYSMENDRFKVGLGLFHYRGGKSYTENEITRYSSLDLPSRYLFTNFTETRTKKLLFTGKTQKILNSSGLFLVDRRKRIRGIKDFGFGWFIKDDTFKESEQEELLEALRRNLPTSLFSQMQELKIFPMEKRSYAKLQFQVFLHRGVFHLLEDVNKEELRLALNGYLKQFPVDYGILRMRPSDEEEMLDQMVRVLAESREDISVRERIKWSMKLHENEIFQEIGIGFVLSLIPPEKLEDYVHIILNFKALNTPSVKYHYGKVHQSHEYKELMLIQSMLNERTLEIRDAVIDENISEAMQGDVPSKPISRRQRIFQELYR
jgi:hypothetical protein